MPPTKPTDARRVSALVGTAVRAGRDGELVALLSPCRSWPADLDVSTGVSAWAISLYALMLAVATAVYGRVSDLLGIRKPLLVGVGLMTSGALVAAFAPNFGILLAARIFQGAGAAAVPTLGVAIVSARYTGCGAGSVARQGRRPRGSGELPRPVGRWRHRGVARLACRVRAPDAGSPSCPVPVAFGAHDGQRSPARHVRRRAGRRHGGRRGAAGAVAVDRPGRGRGRRGAAAARRAVRGAVGAAAAPRLPAEERHPQRHRGPQCLGRGVGAGCLVRAAHRGAGGAGRHEAGSRGWWASRCCRAPPPDCSRHDWPARCCPGSARPSRWRSRQWSRPRRSSSRPPEPRPARPSCW